MTGIAFDRQRGILYGAQLGGERPIVHVFQVTDQYRKVNKKQAGHLSHRLTVWDQIVCSAAVHTATEIFAAYTDGSGTPISGARCSAVFADATGAMIEEGGHYRFERSFSAAGKYQYTVSCTKTGHKPLSLDAAVIVTAPQAEP